MTYALPLCWACMFTKRKRDDLNSLRLFVWAEYFGTRLAFLPTSRLGHWNLSEGNQTAHCILQRDVRPLKSRASWLWHQLMEQTMDIFLASPKTLLERPLILPSSRLTVSLFGITQFCPLSLSAVTMKSSFRYSFSQEFFLKLVVKAVTMQGLRDFSFDTVHVLSPITSSYILVLSLYSVTTNPCIINVKGE